MANAIKCENCGKFEESLGYSVRIYQHKHGHDRKGNPSEYAKKVLAKDCLCYECASEIAESLHDVLIPDEEE